MDPNDTISTVVSFNRVEEEREAEETAASLGLNYANLSSYPAAGDVLNLFEGEEIKDLAVIPYLKANDQVKLALKTPLAPQELQELQTYAAKHNYTFIYIFVSNSSYTYLKKLKDKYPQKRPNIDYNQAVSKPQIAVNSFADLAKAIQETTITNMLDIVLLGADKLGASDIHIEPRETDALIRFRIDGVLHNAAMLAKEQFKGLLSRIKLLAQLKIESIIGPQDGRFGFSVAGKQVDLRVSSLPTIYGEGLVLRLLEQENQFKTLAELGFRIDLEKTIRIATHKPFGIILSTGPTGSGKTTTMYAILQDLNKPDRKIITLEDPVEYRIKGIIQSQVDEKMTFVGGLRAILRQDPDIILVGEIRDLETAGIAVNAALTGHLLLSTLHTNNASASLARLLDLGVPPFLLSGSINLILAQRLVRILCKACKKSIPTPPNVAENIRLMLPGYNVPPNIFANVGCPKCAGTGYKGRAVIAEALVPSSDMEKLVLQKSSLRELSLQARRDGMVSMEQDGLIKVYMGITTPEEVWRVTAEI